MQCMYEYLCNWICSQHIQTHTHEMHAIGRQCSVQAYSKKSPGRVFIRLKRLMAQHIHSYIFKEMSYKRKGPFHKTFGSEKISSETQSPQQHFGRTWQKYGLVLGNIQNESLVVENNYMCDSAHIRRPRIQELSARIWPKNGKEFTWMWSRDGFFEILGLQSLSMWCTKGKTQNIMRE